MAQEYHILDTSVKKFASVVQKTFIFTGKCVIIRNERQTGDIVPKITLFKPKYEVKGLGRTIEGYFNQDKYSVKQDERPIVNVQVWLFTKGSAFEIDAADGIDKVNAIAAVLTIEGFLETKVIESAVNSSVQSSLMS